MKFTGAISALLVGTAAAFAPNAAFNTQGTSTVSAHEYKYE